MKALYAIIAFVASQLSFSQATQPLKNFSALTVSSRIQVTLMHSTENKLVVTEGISANLVVDNQNGGLGLSLKESDLKDDTAITVYFTDDISSLEASEGSKITSTDTLTPASLSIAASSGAVITIKTDTGNISSAATSGAAITVTGTVVNHTVSITSGAEINAKGLLSTGVTATISSGAFASVYASQNVVANASSGAKLLVYGNPKEIQKTKSSGGKIKFK